jgi:hypothetical protein
MKKVFASLLLSLVAASAFGQDAKPTKAQTIEYIQSNYPRSIDYATSMLISAEDGRLMYTGTIRDIALDINGSKVVITYVSTLHQIMSGEHSEGSDRYLITFDLKDIEAIDGQTSGLVGPIPYDEAEVGSFPMYLLFKAAGGKETITVTKNGESRQVSAAQVPFAIDGVTENHAVLREFVDWQIYKAFVHLRKLSGGPDPIRF